MHKLEQNLNQIGSTDHEILNIVFTRENEMITLNTALHLLCLDWKFFSDAASVLTPGSLPPLSVPNISNSVKIGSIWCQFNGHSLDLNQWKGT